MTNFIRQLRLHFSKYHGTGNDFILLEGRLLGAPLTEADIAHLCHRHYGVGADGLIVVSPSADGQADYDMTYYNADGRLSSMCGNGARCAFHFAQGIGLAGIQAKFVAYDGLHSARGEGNLISVSMRDVAHVEGKPGESYILDTGSPHFIQFVREVEAIDVYREGQAIRNSPEFQEKGINVNFAEIRNEGIRVRTYERGVEDITMSCGTGVTAVAIAFASMQKMHKGPVQLITDGGKLAVDFGYDGGVFKKIQLIGPATHVFDATIDTDT